jgi:hypothetical protein
MVDLLAVIFLFGGGTAFLLAISPVGRAIADRIRSGGDVAAGLESEQLREAQLQLLDEMEVLRRDVADMQERLDFAERLLAQNQDPGELPPGPDMLH